MAQAARPPLRDRARLRHWATEAWYYGRLTVLGLAALLIIGWIVMTIVFVNWPGLAGSFGPWLEQTQRKHVVKPLDSETQHERWGDAGPKNPQGESPYEYWKHHRPLVTKEMDRHQQRGRLATNPSVSSTGSGGGAAAPRT